MAEPCDDFESCEQICQDSIHYGIPNNFNFLHNLFFLLIANSKSNPFLKSSSITWIILAIAILGILLITIIIMTLRYRRQKRNAKNTAASSRMLEKKKCPNN